MTLPNTAGVGLKPRHIAEILETPHDMGWFEIHAENYMGEGGPPHHFLARIIERWPVSLHGVGLSIGGTGGLDQTHLQRLRKLNQRYPFAMFSEHLAWSSHGEVFLNDLLPLPYTPATLDRVCAHIDEVQNALGRQMLLENPSTYVTFQSSSIAETDFLSAVVSRTGCGLLLDVNNVFVSATNHGYSPEAYIDSFPLAEVGEIHLGGHAPDTDETGAALLVDAHDREVADPVWELYARVIGRTGPLPTLIEWDNDVPDWPTLLGEAHAAGRIMRTAGHASQAA